MGELIAIQGGPASYHEAAVRQLYPDEADTKIRYCGTFLDVYAALEAREVDSAVVAISNNRVQYISGGAQDYLTEHATIARITGETYVRIRHALLAPVGATLEGIQEVHSQAPALGQCGRFLEQHLRHAGKIEQDDTALSAQLVAKWGDPTKAAIASEAAGVLHGLRVVKANIQDDRDNITRFVTLRRADEFVEPEGANKTTILLTTAQKVGSLAEALTLFAQVGINLTSIQSQIIPNSAFKERFWLEFDAGESEERTQAVLKRLIAAHDDVTVLGSYKAAPIPIGH